MGEMPDAMAARGGRGTRPSLSLICLVITIIILVAGLWPFNFHAKNEVTWLDGQDGLLFGRRGIAYSTEPLYGAQGPIPTTGPISFELAVRPTGGAGRALAQMLTFYGEEDRHFVALAQWKSHLVLRASSQANGLQGAFEEVSARNVLSRNTPALLTVTSHDGDTTVYADGQMIAFTRNFPIPPVASSASGRVVLGNSPSGRNPWKGQLLFLACYDRALSADEVFRHYQGWTAHRTPAWLPAETPTLLYRFDERIGTTARNQGGYRCDISFPPVFRALTAIILRPPWREEYFGRSFLRDVLINVLGFVPFGFFLAAWLRQDGGLPAKYSVFLAPAIGGVLSLAIELSQVYLPSRSSSLTDLFGNMSGTILGTYMLARFILLLRPEKRR